MICQICGKEIKSNNHFNKAHNITVKTYYDKYLKSEEVGQCKICGKETSFIGITTGYRLYCSVKCSQNDPEVRAKVLETTQKNLMNNYGVINVQQIPEVQEKTKQTCLKKYKTEYAIASHQVQEKIKNTIQENYGVDYPLQSKEIRQKGIDTLKETYGVDNPAKSEVVQEKMRQTSMNRYGKEHYTQTDEYQKKRVKKYLYDNNTFDSSWELALYIYAKDHHLEIERTPIMFEYLYEGKLHKYIPDFMFNGKLIEIKSEYYFENGKLINPHDRSQDGLYEAKHQCIIQNKVELWTNKEMKPILQYMEEIYSKNWLDLFIKN